MEFAEEMAIAELEKWARIIAKNCMNTLGGNESCREMWPDEKRFGSGGDEEYWCYACQIRDILGIGEVHRDTSTKQRLGE